MRELQSETVAPRGILPYYFLVDHGIYAGENGDRPGDVVGLKVDVGDRLAATTIKSARADRTAFQSPVCRRATASDLARYANRGRKQRRATEPLVPVEFERTVGQYRGPTEDKRADIAGFTARVAKRYCEGYLNAAGKRVGAVAHYYIATVDEELEVADPASEKKVDRPKPARRAKRNRRQKTSPDSTGAPHQKGE